MLPHKFNVEVWYIECFSLELRYDIDIWIKVLNEGRYVTKWVKNMKQIKVVKRRGQNEHLKQGDEQKQIYIL